MRTRQPAFGRRLLERIARDRPPVEGGRARRRVQLHLQFQLVVPVSYSTLGEGDRPRKRIHLIESSAIPATPSSQGCALVLIARTTF